jgi:hypothetical protein
MSATRFKPTPAPGELITSKFMLDVVGAVTELQDAMTKLNARVAKLEQQVGGGPTKPTKWDVEIDKDRLKEILKQFGITKETPPDEKVKKGVELLYRYKEQLIPEGDPGDPRPEEIVSLLAEMGVGPVDAVPLITTINPGIGAKISTAIVDSGTDEFALQSVLVPKGFG